MKHNYIVFISGLILIGIIIVLFLKLVEQDKDLQSIKIVSDEYARINNKNDLLLSNMMLQWQSEDFTINDIFIEDINREKIKLSSLVKDKPVIVFRYSENHCESCVTYTLYKLKQMFDKINANNIIILSSYSNVRKFTAFIRSNKIELPIYNTGQSNLGIPMEDIEYPYLFVLDKNMVAKMIFIPTKEIDEYTIDYLKLIKRRFGRI